MKIILAVLSLLITIAFYWLLSTRLGNVPAIGKLVNPVSGFWKNEESSKSRQRESIKTEGLKQEVIIKYDSNRVPHVFALNDHDLYFAQGYITARDRLWQMDLQIRKAAGRLSEVFGERTVNQDRYYRDIGLKYAAEKSLRLLEQNPEAKTTIDAYTAGVNAYINQLKPSQYPIEFKLLDYAPEKWEPVNCVLLIKLMAETLSGGSDDFGMTNNLNVFGPDTTMDLFPDRSFREEPIIPAGTKLGFQPLPVAKKKVHTPQGAERDKITAPRPEGIGSNNWAVSAAKSKTGFPVLANDPHLSLTYPSIWYQVQLASPSVNVYGVSIPGSPCIIIGFNKSISWGVTNAEADMQDWYQVRFSDSSKKEYWYNNHWIPARQRQEEINIRGRKSLSYTVIYTHYGPVVYWKKDKEAANGSVTGYAMRWVALEESEEIRTFYQLNRASDYNDYRNALQHYASPAQNFIFASANNDIAITSTGKYPLRYQGQGKYILDGGDSQEEWQGWIPFSQNPNVLNPERGFVSSANQSPVDSTYPYYLSYKFGAPERAMRINKKLSAMNNITADSFRVLQTDNYSVFADEVLDTMVSLLNAALLNASQKECVKMIGKWNRRFDAGEAGATLFSAWWVTFYNNIWLDEFEKVGQEGRLPGRDRTAKLLLKERNASWFDNIHTPNKETCIDLLNASFMATVDSLLKRYGPPGKDWEWGQTRRIVVNHLAKIDALGSSPFISGGSATSVNALSNSFGPSWRMVVELGPQVKGYGILAGGQSGNPGSKYYDNELDTWTNGQLKELLFLTDARQLSGQIISTLTLKK
jgi:penicillin G amidase